MRTEKIRNAILACSAVLMLLAMPFTSHGQSTVAAADSAYNAKEYSKAIELYKLAEETEGTSAPMLFNMGNAYFQEGDYGHAMLSWLRAKRLDPGQKEINSNLRYLRSRVEDSNKAEQKGKRYKVIPDESSFFRSVHTAIAEERSSDMWAVWGAVLFFIFVGCCALYIFSHVVIARKVGFFGGMLALLFSVIFVAFAIAGARAASAEDTGVITAFKVTLQTEPGKESENDKGGVLTKGTEVQILSEETDAEGSVTWYKVRLNSDYIGWVSAEDLELV